MDEFQIATSLAQLLTRLQHPDDTVSVSVSVSDNGYDSDYRHYSKLSTEEIQMARLNAMTAKLAAARASAHGKDFGSVLRDTEFRVSVELARILAATIDPVLEGLKKVAAEEEEEVVCGVCQEEIERGDEEARAMGCNHAFHGYCIVKWLKHKNVCPLCRFQHHM